MAHNIWHLSFYTFTLYNLLRALTLYITLDSEQPPNSGQNVDCLECPIFRGFTVFQLCLHCDIIFFGVVVTLVNIFYPL